MGKMQGTVKMASSPSLVSLWKKYTARIIWYAMRMRVLRLHRRIHCQDYLVCDENEGVEVAQTDLADAVFERYEGYDAEHRAYQLEDGGEGEALECRYFYEADDGVLSDEADHGCEEHGDEQSGCYGQEEALYSEKHIDIDFMGLQAQK